MEFDFNKVWNNFFETVTNHYGDFSGRVNRAQYWYYILVYTVVGIVVAIVGNVVALGYLLRAAYALLLLLPSVGMTARRMQDTGRSGALGWLWAVPVAYSVLGALYAMFTIMTLGLGLIFLPFMGLLGLVALAAAVVLIYFCVQPGEAAANAYGPPPAPWTTAPAKTA